MFVKDSADSRGESWPRPLPPWAGVSSSHADGKGRAQAPQSTTSGDHAGRGYIWEWRDLRQMKAGYAELKDEMNRIKRRVSALERAYDAVTTRDDLQAIEEAREDLRPGKTADLAEAKKSLGP